jgi:uncharacterized protein (DUF1330 family)
MFIDGTVPSWAIDATRRAALANRGDTNAMMAYLLVTLKVHDPVWVDDYVANVPAIIRKHGGKYFAVSESVKRYEGTTPTPDQVALFTFPSIGAIDAFIADPDYAPYKAARLAASSADILAFVPRV